MLYILFITIVTVTVNLINIVNIGLCIIRSFKTKAELGDSAWERTSCYTGTVSQTPILPKFKCEDDFNLDNNLKGNIRLLDN